jgi:hypothetical protein
MYVYEYIATANQTSFSGADSNSQTLSYAAGNIIVSYGGYDLPKSDYTATNGTSVVLDDGAVVGEIVRIVAFQSFVVANTYTQSQADTLLAAKAKLTKSTTAPSSPAQGDMWFDTTSSVVAMKVYNGTAWKLMSDLPFTATGGTITTSGGYRIHTFTSSGTFTPSTSGTVEYLIVAGGGGGANYGAGGAGGFLTATGSSIGSGAQAVTVGAGGAKAAAGNVRGSNGANSSFNSITSIGGGGGASATSPRTGAVGGSGGGGGTDADTGIEGGAGTSLQGNAGGSGANNPPKYVGGGGGGAGGVGGNGNGTNATGGSGGNGLASSISGSSVTYAGGGGGTGFWSGGTGVAGAAGTGGGGAGTVYGTNANGGNGTANTGGGGGGAEYVSSSIGAGTGGSGIVIVRYAV